MQILFSRLCGLSEDQSVNQRDRVSVLPAPDRHRLDGVPADTETQGLLFSVITSQKLHPASTPRACSRAPTAALRPPPPAAAPRFLRTQRAAPTAAPSRFRHLAHARTLL